MVGEWADDGSCHFGAIEGSAKEDGTNSCHAERHRRILAATNNFRKNTHPLHPPTPLRGSSTFAQTRGKPGQVRGAGGGLVLKFYLCF